MKKIEEFLDSVYVNIVGNEKEIKELKAEMRAHLLEAVQELKLKGKSEQDAIDIAIESFGGEKVMRSVVCQLFNAQKFFAKSVLYIAFTFLFCTFAACGVLWTLDEKNMKENYAAAEKILEILDTKEVITENMKAEIKTLVQNKNQILNLQIYKASKAKTKVNGKEITYTSYTTEDKIPTYTYDSTFTTPNWRSTDISYDLNDSDWFVQMETKKIFAFIPFILSIGVAVYVTLFTTWATINAYHHRRLNIGWIIVFVLLNFLGYLIFYFTEKKQSSFD